ncbi:hypothetical protein HKZ40_003808 [Salmonella enterica]|nr:hypothetical protein [Salmonella enterica]
MRVSEQVMLAVLSKGGCIRSFWRRSARLAGTPLGHVDFAVVAKRLVSEEEWTQVVGGTEFGGAVWRLTSGALL